MKLTKSVTGVPRRIYPFDNEPETWIEMQKLPDAVVNRIYDREKYMPGSKTATMTKATAVVRSLICDSITDWNGFSDGSKPMPCTSENKLMLLDVETLNSEGEKSTLWALLQEKFAKLEEEDAKN